MPVIIKATPSQRFGVTCSFSNQLEASKINTLLTLAIGPATLSGVMDKNANQTIASHIMLNAPNIKIFVASACLKLAQ